MTDDLRKADLSRLSVKEMTKAQRAEMRRRLTVFMESYYGRREPAGPQPEKTVRKWVPGMKA